MNITININIGISINNNMNFFLGRIITLYEGACSGYMDGRQEGWLQEPEARGILRGEEEEELWEKWTDTNAENEVSELWDHSAISIMDLEAEITEEVEETYDNDISKEKITVRELGEKNDFILQTGGNNDSRVRPGPTSGNRIEVYWEEEEAFQSGTVTDITCGLTGIRYDNREIEKLDLQEKEWRHKDRCTYVVTTEGQ